MKKLFLSLCLLASTFCMAQTKQKISEVTFYGVDYSLAKVYGASETPGQFLDAFEGINKLFINEAKKYDIAKMLKIKVNDIFLDPVKEQNRKIDRDELIIDGFGGYKVSDDQIAAAVKALPIEQTEGTGMVIIAETLNKASARAFYKVVFFDIESREVIEIWDGKGKARGIGLRNYWAYSVYTMLKKI